MNLKADAPFFEAAFNARLADKLIAAGYGIRRTERDFELASVSRELIIDPISVPAWAWNRPVAGTR
jgi:hypothetical protein